MACRTAVSLVLLWSTLSASAACERGEPAHPRANGHPAQQSAKSEPQSDDKQELVVGAGADEFGLELNRPRLGMYPLNAGICEPLVRLTPDFRIEPWLATKWEYRGDNTYRFTLRSGVAFHDGRPFDARAVKYSLDRTVKRIQYSFLSDESVRIIDDTTVDVRPSQPNLRLVEQLVHPTYAMVAPGSDPSVRPVCTGPFRFTEYVRQDHLTVVRNDAYWREKPRLRKLTFRFIPDDNTRALALRSGDVDAIFDVNRSMVVGLEAGRGIKVVTAPPGAVILIYLATRGTPPHTHLADPVVRRAVALAIDRKTLVERILEGHGSVVSTVNPPAVLGSFASEVRGVPYDPKQAARLLDAAGWRAGSGNVRTKDGQRLTLVMITQPGAVDPAVAQYVQAQLAAVGVEAKIEQLDPGAFESRLNAGRFDLDIEVPSQNDANPAFLLALRWYSKSNVKSAPFLAVGPRFDALVEQALSTPDRDSVQKRAAEAMHVLVDQEVAAIPLAGIYRIYAMKDRVRGFEPHPSRLNQWWNTVWLAR